MRVSNVDKHIREGEFPVRLCNYVDVYKNDRITQTIPFMNATASRDEIERFRLERDVCSSQRTPRLGTILGYRLW